MRRILPLLVAAIVLALPAPPPGIASPEQATAEGGKAGGAVDEGAGLQTGVFTIRYKSVDDVYLQISPYLGPRGSIRAQPRQKTLIVIDTPETIEAIARVVAAYDVPPRSVEVSVQLILASAGPGATEPAPPPIRGVIEKLNALSTRWNDYRMVGAARVLGTEGEQSSLRVGDDYRITFRIDQVTDETRMIRFKPFELARRAPAAEGSETYAPVMNTVLNLRDSQLFIVGASRMEKANRALFMTITASLVRP